MQLAEQSINVHATVIPLGNYDLLLGRPFLKEFNVITKWQNEEHLIKTKDGFQKITPNTMDCFKVCVGRSLEDLLVDFDEIFNEIEPLVDPYKLPLKHSIETAGQQMTQKSRLQIRETESSLHRK